MKYLYQKINNSNIFNDIKLLISIYKVYIFPIIYSIGLYFITVFIVSIIPLLILISLLWIIEKVKKSTLLIGLKNIFHIFDILISTITCKYSVMLLCDLIKTNINKKNNNNIYNFQMEYRQTNEILVISTPFFISLITILILLYKLKLIFFLKPMEIINNNNFNNNNLISTSFFRKTIKFKLKQWIMFSFIFISFIFFKLFHHCFLYDQNKSSGSRSNIDFTSNSKLLCKSFDDLSPTLSNEIIYFGYYGNNAILFIFYLVLTAIINKINQTLSKKIKSINKIK
ncbi:hypothetical protein ACTFIV_006950 [Dictyostelium citrinum]